MTDIYTVGPKELNRDACTEAVFPFRTEHVSVPAHFQSSQDSQVSLCVPLMMG